MRLMFLVIVGLCSISIAEFSESGPALGSSAARLGTGMPTFTDAHAYNSYDFCRSPLGLMEKESSSVRLTIKYRQLGFSSAKSTDTSIAASCWTVPELLIGKPKTIYLMLNYAPGSIIDKAGLKKWEFPLTRFGMAVAGQSEGGIFRFGLSGSGFYGKEKMVNNNLLAGRDVLGIDNLSLHLGSQLHKLFRLGLKGGVSVKVDTSISQGGALPYYEDRYGEGRVPYLGADIDFGDEGFPVKSGFDLQMSTTRFTYVSKGAGSFVPYPAQQAGNGQRSPVMGDSLSWKWQALGIINSDLITYQPSLFLGYWSNKQQLYAPLAEEHDGTYYLLHFGPAIPNANWTLSSFDWGLGGSFTIMQFGKTWIEYARSSMKLTCGSAFTTADREAGYDRIGFGLEANINAIPGLTLPDFIQTHLRLGYLNLRENSTINQYRAEEFSAFNTGLGGSQDTTRYIPSRLWGQDERITNLTLGLGADLWKKMFEANFNIGFLTKQSDRTYGGFEFGMDITYNLKQQPK